jgi:hypothetical protein
MTNAYYSGSLELGVEQFHDAPLAILIECDCRFIQEDPPRFMQEETREREALLLS